MDSIGASLLQNDMLGYTARVLAHALDNRRSHARSAMTCHPGAEVDRVQLSLLVAFQRFRIHALHEVVVLGDFASTGSAQTLSARFRYTFMLFFEQFGCLGGVAEEQLAHHAVGGLIRPFGLRLTPT